MRDFRVIGIESAEPLVRVEGSPVVHELLAPHAPELLDEHLLEIGVIAHQLRLELHQPGSGQELPATLVPSTCGLDQTKRVLPVICRLRALEQNPQTIDELSVIRVLQQEPEVVGHRQLRHL